MERKQALEVLNQRQARGLHTVSVFCFRALTEEERKDLIADNQYTNYSQTPKLTEEEKAHNKAVRERFGMVPGYPVEVVRTVGPLKNRHAIAFYHSYYEAQLACEEDPTLEKFVWSDKYLSYISGSGECLGSDILKKVPWHREAGKIVLDW